MKKDSINIYLDTQVHKKLIQRSKEINVPKSSLVQQALVVFFESSNPPLFQRSCILDKLNTIREINSSTINNKEIDLLTDEIAKEIIYS